MAALLLSLLAAAPVQARFVLEMQGLPLAELRVSKDGARYVYESTHFLEEGASEHRIELALEPGQPLPEVLALLERPAPGCRDVLEERTRKLEQLCIDAVEGDAVTGRLDGARFTATYRGERLERISLPGVTWRAVSAPTRPPKESPFTRGVPVPGQGPLRLEPPVAGATWLSRPPAGIGTEDTVGRLRCLVAAREAVAARPGARVAVGLVLEGGRAYPHAWIVSGGVALEPSVLPGDPVLRERRYLEVPVAQSGAFYLQLFDGSTRLVSP